MASLYIEAGRIVDEVRSRRKGLKDALYTKSSHTQKLKIPLPKLKALVCKALKDGDMLEQVCREVLGDNISAPGVALCMAYDLLLGPKKSIIGGGSLKRLMVDNCARLQQALAQRVDRRQQKEVFSSSSTACVHLPELSRTPSASGSSTSTLICSRPPRYYLRMNTLRTMDGNDENDEDKSAPAEFLSSLATTRDPLIPDCVHVKDAHWETQIAPLVNQGLVAVQDRSSQLAAHAAFSQHDNSSSVGQVIMEVCAAPGSKTSHLIAMAQKHRVLGGVKVATDTGAGEKDTAGAGDRVRKIIAVEKSPKRCRTLLQRLELLCGPLRDTQGRIFSVDKRVPKDTDLKRIRVVRLFTKHNLELVVRCEDFLNTSSSEDYDEAETIVLDPSCSGSGLAEHGAKKEEDAARLQCLAAFQKKMLSKALSLHARTVCYSTCSIYREENEAVVEHCIENTEWSVVTPLPFSWPDPEPYTGIASKCVHCKPDIHACRGFFLAKLQRTRANSVITPVSRVSPKEVEEKKQCHIMNLEETEKGTEKKQKFEKHDDLPSSCLPSAKLRKKINRKANARMAKKRREKETRGERKGQEERRCKDLGLNPLEAGGAGTTTIKAREHEKATTIGLPTSRSRFVYTDEKKKVKKTHKKKKGKGVCI